MDFNSFIICIISGLWWTSVVYGAPTPESDQQQPEQQPPPISIQYQAQNKDGHYKFGYATLDGQYRVEEGSASDVVIGSYGYPSPDGRYIRVFYKADKNGFQILTPPDGERTNPLGQVQPLGFPQHLNYVSAQSQLHDYLPEVPEVNLLTTTDSTTATTPTTTTATTTQKPTTTTTTVAATTPTTTEEISTTETLLKDNGVPPTHDFLPMFPYFHHHPLQLPPPPPPPVMLLQPTRGSGRKMLIFYPPPPVSIPPLYRMSSRLRFLQSIAPFPFATFPNFHNNE